jgi:hypothetical protein
LVWLKKATQLKEFGNVEFNAVKKREFGCQKNAFWHVRVENHGKSWEIYRKTIGHYAADGESMYETEATEQTANTNSRVRTLDSRSILLQHSLSSGGHDVELVAFN